jgi:nitrogenase-associated protein
MTTVIFYEKPGCANNTRQKKLLEAAGHEVIARSLLTEAWTRERLRGFLGDRPVAEWINRAAPRVKSGEIVPEHLDEEQALELMLTDPLFIRRPLMEADGECQAGFDRDRIHAWIGLSEAEDADVQTCTRSRPCPAPNRT